MLGSPEPPSPHPQVEPDPEGAGGRGLEAVVSPPTRAVPWGCPSLSFPLFSPRRSHGRPGQVTHPITLAVSARTAGSLPFLLSAGPLTRGKTGSPSRNGGDGGGSESVASAGAREPASA